MNRLTHTKQNLTLRKKRVRSTITGTATRPRLSVYISNRHVAAQLIDDTKGHTLVSITTVGQKDATGTITEQATWVGTELAKKAVKTKVKAVVFDRNGRKYQGRLKALADAARENGLEF